MPTHIEESVSAPSPAAGSSNERGGAAGRRSANVLWITVALVAAALLVAAGTLVRHWPFTRTALIQSLEQDAQGRVEVGPVSQTYFPHPGCVAENVAIYRDASSPKLTVRRVTIVGSYVGMLHRYIPRVIADGAVLSVPPGGLKELFASNGTQQPTNTRVGEIDADDARIVVASAGNAAPLTFNFRELKLRDVDRKSAVGFVARLQMPVPTGDLKLQGQVGPFRRDQPESIPLSGIYSLTNAKLEEFSGIGGMLSSAGKFKGPLQAMVVEGTTETPDFQLDVGIHPVDLKTKFHAVVDGTNGDIQLDPVESSWGKTSVVWRGTIEGPDDAKDQKTVSLDLVSTSARVQDLLRLFVHEEQSPMSGSIAFQGHAVLLPGEDKFLHRLKMQGEFSIKDGRFTKPKTQQEIDILSARARGEADKIEDDQDRDKRDGTDTVARDLQPVVSSYQGRVSLRDGIATLAGLSFEIPGATALLNGTYGLQSKKIDAQGTAHMESKLDKATTGVKSLVLKVVEPLRGHHGEKGSRVRVHVSGTYGHPSFAVQPMKGGS